MSAHQYAAVALAFASLVAALAMWDAGFRRSRQVSALMALYGLLLLITTASLPQPADPGEDRLESGQTLALEDQ